MERQTVKIKLEKIVDIKKFIIKASKYSSDLYIQCDNLVVNAKSLMGLLSIDLEKPFLLDFESDVKDSINTDFVEWIIN